MNILLIWDIDGTIILGRGIGCRGMDRAFELLYGITEGFKHIDMSGMLDINILNLAYEAHGLKGREPEEYFSKYYECLREESEKLDGPIYAPGIIQLLDTLDKDPRFHNVLGTGNVEGAARIKLSVHDMNKYFPVGGYGNEARERWQVIEKAAAKSREYFGKVFDKDNIYVIGDTPKDIECAKILGTRCIAVATGGYPVETLLKHGADFVFEDFTNTDAFLNIFR